MVTPTITTFEAYALHPDNRHKRLEYHNGEVIELVSNDIASSIAILIASALVTFVVRHQLGRVTGADGGYQVGDNFYIPDVAFIANQRQPQPTGKGYNPLPPDLAVEVISNVENATELDELRQKTQNYTAAGTTVWVVNPVRRTLEIYAPGQAVQIIPQTGIVNGGDILPGFTMPLSDIFPLEDTQ